MNEAGNRYKKEPVKRFLVIITIMSEHYHKRIRFDLNLRIRWKLFAAADSINECVLM